MTAPAARRNESIALPASQRSSRRASSSTGPARPATASASSSIPGSNCGRSNVIAPTTLPPIVTGMEHAAAVPWSCDSAMCILVTCAGRSAAAGYTIVACWSIASSIAPAMARMRLLFSANCAVCETARTRARPRSTNPRLTRSQLSFVAAAVTKAVAAG
jgi:hypothetical protein